MKRPQILGVCIAWMVTGLLLCADSALAQLDPGDVSGGPTNVVLDSWSFNDHTNWTSDFGCAPANWREHGFVAAVRQTATFIQAMSIPAFSQKPPRQIYREIK